MSAPPVWERNPARERLAQSVAEGFMAQWRRLDSGTVAQRIAARNTLARHPIYGPIYADLMADFGRRAAEKVGS